MHLKDTYNKIAEDWTKVRSKNTNWHPAADKFISLLSQGTSVLDIGCGGGLTSEYLVEKGLHVTGIDFSEKMIEIAKKRVPEGKFIVMDVKDLGDLEESFDGIYAQAVLLHFPKNEIPTALEILNNKLNHRTLFHIS